MDTPHKQPHEVIIPTIDESNPLELYQGAALKLAIDALEKEVDCLSLDPSNPVDHKHFGSFNRKMGSFGVKVEAAGKGIVDPMNKEIKVFNEIRKGARERIAAIRVKFMAPRVAFDEEVAAHNRRINDSFELMHHGHKQVGEFGKATAQEWETLIANIEDIEMAEELFTDRLEEAKALKAESLEMNRARFAKWTDDEAALEAGRKALQVEQDKEAAERHAEREAEKKAKESQTVPPVAEAKAEAKEAPKPAVTPESTAKNAVYGQLLKRGMDKDKAILFVNAIAAGEIEYLKLEV